MTEQVPNTATDERPTYPLLYLGDCFDNFKHIQDHSIDLVVVDLPYGNTDCEWDIHIDHARMWDELKRIGKENTAFIFFGNMKLGFELMKTNLKWFRYELVWKKTTVVNFFNAKVMPLRNHEMLFVFYKHKPTYNPQMTTGHKPFKERLHKERKGSVYGSDAEYNLITRENTGTRHPKTVLEYKVPTLSNRHHPTQKPLDLMEWLIRSYSNEQDIVLDFTMGSGTTGVSCATTKRNFIGMEMDEKYYEIAKGRLCNPT